MHSNGIYSSSRNAGAHLASANVLNAAARAFECRHPHGVAAQEAVCACYYCIPFCCARGAFPIVGGYHGATSRWEESHGNHG